jgi:hypothetical protein
VNTVSLDVKAIVARAQLGDALDDVDFFWIGRFADTHALRDVVAALAPGRATSSFYLADAFDAKLAHARQAYAVADDAWNTARDWLGRTLASRLGYPADSDDFIVARGALSPLPSSVRVVRSTAAYLTLAFEPDDAVVAAAQKRDTAFAEVKAAESRARRTLAEQLVRHADVILAAANSRERARPARGEGVQ